MVGILIKLFFVIFIIVKLHSFIADELINPYKLVAVIGKKGSGKTTDIAKNVRKDLKNGWRVYSNIDIPGAIKFDVKYFGKCTFPPQSSVYIDEIALIYNNRAWKTFSKETLSAFKYQRQNRTKITVYSQTLDFDVSLRNLIDKFFIVSNVFTTFSLKREIRKTLGIKKDKDGNGDLVDTYEYVPLLAGGWSFTYIPKYIPLFKSYNPVVKDYIFGERTPEPDPSIYVDGNLNFLKRFTKYEVGRAWSCVVSCFDMLKGHAENLFSAYDTQSVIEDNEARNDKTPTDNP